jgi:hypothetical protein
MENVLRSLRDIEGVLGSFLVDGSGLLLARDMPSIFDELTLRSASQRLSQLRAAFESDGHAFEGCTARFGGHLLVLRAAEKRTLCVLCPVGTNMNTLQMGLNLVARRSQDVSPRASLPPSPSFPGLAPTTSLGPSSQPAAPTPGTGLSPSAQSVSSAPSAAGPLARTPSAEQGSEPHSITRFFRGRPVP